MERFTLKEQIKLIGAVDDDTVKRYSYLIESVAQGVEENVSDSKYLNDARVVIYAAAKCLCAIKTAENDSNISSFKAGDVSYSVGNKSTTDLTSLLAVMRDGCKGLIKDNSFAFTGV